LTPVVLLSVPYLTSPGDRAGRCFWHKTTGAIQFSVRTCAVLNA